MSADESINHLGTLVHHVGQSLDSSKKYYQGISSSARQLDDMQTKASSVAQLFSTDLVILRVKISDTAAKLALKEPKVFGQKCENLIWWKVIYSAYSRGKHLKNSSDSDDSALIRHLLAAIGFYHSFILKIQTEYCVHGNVDFSTPIGMQQLSVGHKKKDKSHDSASLEWATLALQRSLISIGDLHRYLNALRPSFSSVLSARFYIMASHINPKLSMPFNQLGRLAGARGRKFDASYFYMRCMCCASPSDGAEANLRRSLKSDVTQWKLGSRDPVRVCLAKFLSLIDAWWFNESDRETNINLIFDDCMLEFKANLSFVNPVSCAAPPTETIENMFREEWLQSHFSSDVLVKMMAILLMTYHKLEKQNPVQASSVVVFIFNVVNSLTKKLIAGHLPLAEEKPVKQKRCKLLMRRRKRVGGDCSDGSDCESEGEEDSKPGSEPSSESEESEAEFSASSSEEEQVEENVLKSQALPALGCIKLCCDWMHTDEAILRMFFSNFQPLFEDFVKFLNAVAHDCSLALKNVKISGSLEEVAKSMQPYPLTEDVALQGHEVIDQSSLTWSFYNSSPFKSDVLIRMCKLVHFGVYMANSSLVGVKFDPASNTFSLIKDFVPPAIKPEKAQEPTKKEQQKKLMEHMGALWLQEEVRNLEVQVKGRGNFTVSPYIVLDTSALLSSLHLVKDLVQSKQFVVILPIAVFETLDELKKESSRARECARFLEREFLSGNRCLRQQRANESLTIPWVKKPKKKDKDAMTFFKILECCYHLVKQQLPQVDRSATNNNMVTLLCENAAQSHKDFSAAGLASTAGVQLESIKEFHQMWKKSMKGRKN